MDTELDNIKRMVTESADRIMEHVDSVQIMVTFHEGSTENTKSFEYGKGNFYSRLGQVHEWLTIQNRYAVNEAIRRDDKND